MEKEDAYNVEHHSDHTERQRHKITYTMPKECRRQTTESVSTVATERDEGRPPGEH